MPNISVCQFGPDGDPEQVSLNPDNMADDSYNNDWSRYSLDDGYALARPPYLKYKSALILPHCPDKVKGGGLYPTAAPGLGNQPPEPL